MAAELHALADSERLSSLEQFFLKQAEVEDVSTLEPTMRGRILYNLLEEPSKDKRGPARRHSMEARDHDGSKHGHDKLDDQTISLLSTSPSMRTAAEDTNIAEVLRSRAPQIAARLDMEQQQTLAHRALYHFFEPGNVV